MIILAFDPGETTGAVRLVTGGTWIWPPTVSSFDITTLVGLIAWWRSSSDGVDLVIVEEFHLFPHKALAQIGSMFETVRVIGHLEILAYSSGLLVTYQLPSCQHSWKDSTLKRLGFYLTSRHQRSALKHALHWLAKNHTGYIPTS